MNKTLNEKYVTKLKAIADEYYRDPEAAHIYADGILVEFLRELGYIEVAKAFEKIDKWYS